MTHITGCTPNHSARRPAISLAVWLACVCLLALACSFRAHADDPIVIQLKWLHQFQSAGFYAALEKGYFADEGLDVELRERDPTRNNVHQVLDGEAHYGVADSVLLLHHARGDPVVLIAAILQHSPNALLTLANSGLDAPEDLVGRRIAFYNNNSEGSNVLALLAENGIIEKGLVRVGYDNRIENLVNGTVDAITVYLTNEPYVFREMGVEVNILHPRSYGLDLYGDMLFTRQQEAEQHPERVAAVRRAVLRGWEYALSHKEEMVELILARYNTQSKTRQALLQEANAIEEMVARHTTPLGSFDQSRIDYLVNRLNELNLFDAKPGRRSGLVFSTASGNTLALTSEEKAFLATLDKVRFAVEPPGWPPFEMIDGQGRFQGIASDYVTLLSEKLGIEFELVTDMDWNQILDAARQRQIDLLPAAVPTPDRQEYLNFTTPYVRSPMVIVTRDDVDYIASLDQLQGMPVGVVAGYASDELLSRYSPDLDLRRFGDTRTGLEDLASGETFAFIGNLSVATHNIKTLGLSNLKVSGQTPYAFDMGIGIRNDWPLLASAIEKVLATTTTQQHNAIYDRWVSLNITQPFPWRRAMPVIAAALLAFGLMALYLWRMQTLNRRIQLTNEALEKARQDLQNKNRQLQELSITDKLTGVFNRHYLDAELANALARSRRYGSPLSVVLLDLDHFKRINDEFGHQTGDLALAEFARLVTDTVRTSDIFGRWGGEEFLLLCPATPLKQAVLLAEKIRRQLVSEPLGGQIITVSAGVADSTETHSADELITTADSRLYQAKREGRNRVRPEPQ